MKHGLLEPVLASLTQALEQFDRAVERGTVGRRAHVGARAELEAIADEVGQVVRLMDGSNRFRFANDPESLAAWESASNTFGPVRSGGQADGRTGGRSRPETPTQGGTIEPAA